MVRARTERYNEWLKKWDGNAATYRVFSFEIFFASVLRLYLCHRSTLKYPCDEGIQHLCYWLLFFFFCCRPWNWYFSGTTWSSKSKADIFCCEWQWFQTFSRGISLVYNKHPLLNVFPQLKQFIDQKLVFNFVVSRRAIELAFELNLTLLTIYHTTLMMSALRVWWWINL